MGVGISRARYWVGLLMLMTCLLLLPFILVAVTCLLLQTPHLRVSYNRGFAEHSFYIQWHYLVVHGMIPN